MLSHALISLQTCLHWRAIKNTAHKSKCLVLECRTLGWAYATKTGEKKKTTVTQFAWGWTSRLCGEEKEISEPGLKTGKKKKKKKIRSSRSTASHSRNLPPTPREKRQKNKHHISAGHFRKQFTYRCGCGATLPESCVSRTGEARRRCMCVCVCLCACASGGDRSTEEEIWHIWRATQPGGGAQRAGMRQHPSADSRRAACGPTREGRTRLTHCTSSNSFTAGAVWVVGAFVSGGGRGTAALCCVCLSVWACVWVSAVLHHISQRWIQTSTVSHSSVLQWHHEKNLSSSYIRRQLCQTGPQKQLQDTGTKQERRI